MFLPFLSSEKILENYRKIELAKLLFFSSFNFSWLSDKQFVPNIIKYKAKSQAIKRFVISILLNKFLSVNQ